MTIKVTHCSKEGKQRLPAGTTIAAENLNGILKYAVDGSEPVRDIKKVIVELADIHYPDEPTPDETMGTKLPKSLGQTWTLNGDQLAKAASRLPFQLTGSDFTGGGQLVEVSTVDGKLLETIRLRDTCKFDCRSAKGGRTFRNLEMKFDATLKLRLDEGTHLADKQFSRTVTYKVADPTGTSSIRIERTKEIKYNAIPK